MSENAMGRRQALRGAGIAAGGVAIAGLATTPALADNDNGLLGSWMSVRQDDGSPDKVRLVLSFAGGGVFVSHDISPAGPPFTGTWRSRRHDSFRATVLTGTPGDGPGAPGAVIELKLRGAVRHERVSGTFTFTVMGPDGTELDSGSGTFDGRPIEA